MRLSNLELSRIPLSKPLDLIQKPAAPERTLTPGFAGPSELTSILGAALGPSESLQTRNQQESDARNLTTPAERVRQSQDIKNHFDYLRDLAGDNQPEKLRAINQAEAAELSKIGVSSVDPFSAPHLERFSPEQAKNLFGTGERTSRNIASAQGAVAGAAEGFLNPEGALMIGPGSLAKLGFKIASPAAARATAGAVGKGFTAEMVKSADEALAKAAGHYSAGDKEAGDAEAINGLSVLGLVAIPHALGTRPKTPAEALAKVLDELQKKSEFARISQSYAEFKGAQAGRPNLVPGKTLNVEANAFNRGQVPEGAYYASEIPSPEGVLQREIRPRVGPEAPLRQQGEPPGARPSEGAPGSPPNAQVAEPVAPPAQVIPDVQQFQADFNDPNVRLSNQHTQALGMKLKSIADLEALANMNEANKAEMTEFKRRVNAGEKLSDAEMSRMLQISLRVQFPREVIETATNTGSWSEANKTALGSALGERPLDWKKNPEVEAWLRANSDKLGIKLERSRSSQ